jgi:transcription elongation factor GreA
MSTTHYLSQEGYDNLVAELDHLKTTGRSDIAKAIAEAREKGDLSENAEYDAAKNAQGMLEMKISGLNKIMANARVLDKSQLDTSKVTVMSKVTIKNTKNKAKLIYQLVAQSEANLAQKKISIESPMGQGLLGKSVGDTATVTTPNGEMVFEIIDITL